VATPTPLRGHTHTHASPWPRPRLSVATPTPTPLRGHTHASPWPSRTSPPVTATPTPLRGRREPALPSRLHPPLPVAVANQPSRRREAHRLLPPYRTLPPTCVQATLATQTPTLPPPLPPPPPLPHAGTTRTRTRATWATGRTRRSRRSSRRTCTTPTTPRRWPRETSSWARGGTRGAPRRTPHAARARSRSLWARPTGRRTVPVPLATPHGPPRGPSAGACPHRPAWWRRTALHAVQPPPACRASPLASSFFRLTLTLTRTIVPTRRRRRRQVHHARRRSGEPRAGKLPHLGALEVALVPARHAQHGQSAVLAAPHLATAGFTDCI